MNNINEPSLYRQEILGINSINKEIRLFTEKLLQLANVDTIDDLYNYLLVFENRINLQSTINKLHTNKYAILYNQNMPSKGYKPWIIKSINPYGGKLKIVEYVFFNEQSSIDPKLNNILDGNNTSDEIVVCECPTVENCVCDETKVPLYSDTKLATKENKPLVQNMPLVVVAGLILAGVILAWNK